MNGKNYIKKSLCSLITRYFFSGKPLDFGNVFTAFGVTLLGLFLSVCLFLVEIITSKYGCCKKAMNTYNYRIGKSEDNKSMSAEAKEFIAECEVSELLLKKHSSPQDIKLLRSQFRTSVVKSNVVGSE